MAELLPLLKLLKEVVTNLKALHAADFDLQHYQGKANFRNLSVENSDGTIDVGSLLKRKNNLTTALESLRKKAMEYIQSRDSNNMCRHQEMPD